MWVPVCEPISMVVTRIMCRLSREGNSVGVRLTPGSEGQIGIPFSIGIETS